MTSVGVIDYGMGNLHSVRAALETLGADVRVTAQAEELAACERLVLPGVGSFRRAMENIRARGLDRTMRSLVGQGKPLLGICLGMQLLAAWGTEDGDSEGLRFVDARVQRFRFDDRPVPHVGFNTVRFTEASGLLPDSSEPSPASDFYFVHSYHMACANDDDVIGWCDYGGPFAAVVRSGRVVGTQFHPEKSQSNGLKLLRRFLTGGL